MANRRNINLPDLLGTITEGVRLNLDVVQCALALRPSLTPAGKPFEAILLLQNASDINVDVTAQLKLPQRDANNKRNRFFAKTARLLVGLRPAEVGYLTLPISSSPQTAPAEDYRLEMQLQVTRVDKQKPQRVREPGGGGFFDETELADDIQEYIWQLNQLIFSAERVGRSGIATMFGVRPQTLAPVADFSPDWVSLWTMRDHVDEQVLVDRVREPLAQLIPQLTRDAVFYPLMQHLQERFKAVGYPLQVAEAIMTTKLLTLVVEQGTALLEQIDMVGGAVEGEPLHYPNWFLRAARLLFDKPEAVNSLDFMLGYVLDDLLVDAVPLGMNMVSTVVGESFGGPEGHQRYAGQFDKRLKEGRLDFTTLYLPLVLPGLIANTRVVMQNEKPRETVWMLSQAREARLGERGEENERVFQITDTLIDRALDQTG